MPLAPPRFYTQEEMDLAKQQQFYEGIFTGYRGSACCVKIDTPKSLLLNNDNNDNNYNNVTTTTISMTLLMGIAHVKTPGLWTKKAPKSHCGESVLERNIRL
jgi:hypothetical protein